MNKVSDDKLPMTGTWYRMIDSRWCLGKVARIDRGMVTMHTSAGHWVGSIERFAAEWELS